LGWDGKGGFRFFLLEGGGLFFKRFGECFVKEEFFFNEFLFIDQIQFNGPYFFIVVV
jgi:hypothetical protein